MVERTYLLLSALELLAILSLVAVWMIQLFDGRVSPIAQESLRTMSNVNVLRAMLTILWHVIEDSWRPAEVPHVMCVQAVLRVVRVGSIRTPASFVLVHVEGETLHLLIKLLQVLVESWLVQQAFNHVIVLLVLILHAHVQCLDQLEVLSTEVDEAGVRVLLLVQSDNQWPIESSLTVKL